MANENTNRVVKVLTNINVAKTMSDRLLGDEHPVKHRMYVGGCLMAVGVLISKIEVGYFHFIFEGLGYLVHGAGTIPFIDWFSREKPTIDKEIPTVDVSNPKEMEVSNVETT